VRFLAERPSQSCGMQCRIGGHVLLLRFGAFESVLHRNDNLYMRSVGCAARGHLSAHKRSAAGGLLAVLDLTGF